VAGRAAWWWIQLWRRCHELVWATDRKAQWRRVEWPESGAVLDQWELVVSIFSVITDEKSIILKGQLEK
jgi:hypothetical protein